MDDTTGFAGALDRFDFKLIGKKEKFIYYDNFQMFNQKTCSTEKLHSTKGFPNPDCVRWELHRVWVVEAMVKHGFRHAYPKRIFYWDEDTFGAGMSENYDADGKLYRSTISGFFPFYEALGGYSYYYFHLDLKTGAGLHRAMAAAPSAVSGLYHRHRMRPSHPREWPALEFDKIPKPSQQHFPGGFLQLLET